MKTNPLPIAKPAVSQAANDIRNLKPPVEIPNGWLWVWWTLALLAVAAIAWLAWRHWRKKSLQPIPVPVIPPHVRARQRLQEALALIEQPRPFCISVSDTARLYLEERFNFHAPERTTEEFLHELQATNRLLPDQKQSLGEFLSACDMVKFARYEPGRTELQALHDSATRLIDETEPQPHEPQTASASPPP